MEIFIFQNLMDLKISKIFSTQLFFFYQSPTNRTYEKTFIDRDKIKKNKKIENGPRKIDMDIIFYGKQNISNKKLTIPHPRAHLRDFVLRPIADIDSNFIHPTKKISIRNLISQLDENFTFRKLSNRNLR